MTKIRSRTVPAILGLLMITSSIGPVLPVPTAEAAPPPGGVDPEGCSDFIEQRYIRLLTQAEEGPFCDDDGGANYNTESPPDGYPAHAAPRQADRDRNLVGDAFEALYGELKGLEDVLSDPDQDGLNNLREFKWGTIPVLATSATFDGINTSFVIDWAKDSDWDGLDDREEFLYWNNFGSEDYDTDEAIAQSELSFEAYALLMESAAVRDPNSLLDFDFDACSIPGNEHAPYVAADRLAAEDLGDANSSLLHGCSHVADDPDSDGDGLLDGEEAAPGTGIGRWIDEAGTSQWIGGAFPWARDSDCRTASTTFATELGNQSVVCEDLGNYWNTTQEENGQFYYLLEPGAGDGLPDDLEWDWWAALEASELTKWNPQRGIHQKLWAYHAEDERGGWITSDGDPESPELAPAEIDFDRDGAMPLLDLDSDGDGYTDLAEYLTHNPGYALPGQFLKAYNVTNETWRANNEPACDVSGLLPYAPDADFDGLSDRQECGTVTDPHSSVTDPFAWDTDGDGLPDGWEAWFGLDPLVADNDIDSDGDGLTNDQEYCYRPAGLLDLNNEKRFWGCDPTKPEDYWTWNPCSLDPTSTDTDGDSVSDGDEAAQGTNAADPAIATTDCPAGTPLTRLQDPIPNLPRPPHENQDLATYNETLSRHVLEDLYETSAEVFGERITPVEEVMDAADRTREIAQAQVDLLNDVIVNSTPIALRNLTDQDFFSTSDSVPLVSDLAGKEPTEIVEDTFSIVDRVDRDVGLTNLSLVPDLPDPETVARESVEQVERILGDPGTFVKNMTEDLTQSALATVNRSLTSVGVTLPEAPEEWLPGDPREVLKTENVIPDFVFNLFSQIEGTPAWDHYISARNEQGEHLVDTSHFKGFAFREGSDRAVTPNIPLGTTYAWNADGDVGTGAVTDCTVSILCPGGVSHMRGDDLVIRVSAEQSMGDGDPVRPSLWVQKIVPHQAFPWFIAGVLLVHEQNELSDPLGTTEQEGYLAYIGIDGRIGAGTPDGGPSDWTTDRAYSVTDIPDEFQVALRDYGLITTPNVPEEQAGFVDPANRMTIDGTFVDDRADYDSRFVGGVAQYKLDDAEGKVLFDRGNQTSVSILFRGTPETVSLAYASEQSLSDDLETDTLELSWNVTRPMGATDRGVELALERSANHDGAMPSSSLAIVSAALPSGSYVRSSTRWDVAAEVDGFTMENPGLVEDHAFRGDAPIPEAYIKLESWEDRRTDSDPTKAARLWASGIPTSLDWAVDSVSNAYTFEASAPLGLLDLLHGHNDQACKQPSGSPKNWVVIDEPRGDHGCLSVRIWGLQSFRLGMGASAVGGSGSVLDLSLYRDATLGNAPEDAVVVRVDAENWFYLEASDLPTEVSTIGFTKSSPEALSFAYSFQPEASIPSFKLAAMPPRTDPTDGSASLMLEVTDLASSGSGSVTADSQSFEVSFAERVGSARFVYAELPELQEIEGEHVAVRSTADGIAAGGFLTGIKSFRFWGNGSRSVLVSGNISTPGPVTLSVVREGVAQPTDAFEIVLSSIPGPFDVRSVGRNSDTWRIRTTLARPVESITLTGTLQGRNYDLEILSPQDVSLTYISDETLAETRTTLDLEAPGSPLTISGTVTDIGSSLDPQRWLPTNGDHLIDVTDLDGTRTVAIRLTGISDVLLDSWKANEEDGNATLQAEIELEPDTPRTFKFHQEVAQPGSPPEIRSAWFGKLPGTFRIDYNTSGGGKVGFFNYSASSRIELLQISFEDPVRQQSLYGELMGVPTSVAADWDLHSSHRHVGLTHSGDPISSVRLEQQHRDPTAPKYLRLDLRDVPAQIDLRQSSQPLSTKFTARAEDGSLTDMGQADVRFATGSSTVLVPCQPISCQGQEFLTLDLGGEGQVSFGVRLAGPQRISFNLTTGLRTQADLSFLKQGAERAQIDVQTPETVLVGELAVLPSSGALSLDLVQVRPDVSKPPELQRLSVDWTGTVAIAEGRLSLDHLVSEAGEWRRLHADVADLKDLDLSWDAARATFGFDSTHGIGAINRLQYAPVTSFEALGPLVAPNAQDSHYLYLNTSSPGGPVFWLRTWDAEKVRYEDGYLEYNQRPAAALLPFQAYLDTRDEEERGDGTTRLLHQRFRISGTPLPLSVVVDHDGTYERGSFDLTLDTGLEQFTYDRFSNETVPGQRTSKLTSTSLTLDALPTRVNATWSIDSRQDTSEVSFSTMDTGHLGELDHFSQEWEIDWGQSNARPAPLFLPPAHEGFVLVNSTFNNRDAETQKGQGRQIHPDLRETALRVAGLTEFEVSDSDGFLSLNRSGLIAGTRPMLGVYGNATVYAEVAFEAFPTTLSAEVWDHTFFWDDADLRVRSGTVRAQGPLPMGKGHILLESNPPAPTNPRQLLLANVTDLPDEVAVTYRLSEGENHTTGEVYGSDRVVYEGSAAGGSIEGLVRDDETMARVSLQSLPEVLDILVTKDRRNGTVKTTNGTVGTFDVVVRPVGMRTYPSVQGDGLLLSDVQGNLMHLHMTALDEAVWDVEGAGLRSGSAAFHLVHDAGVLPISVAYQGLDESDTVQTVAATVDHLPADWSLDLKAEGKRLWGNYSASEVLTGLDLLWRTGREYFRGALSNLPVGTTSINADVRSDRILEIESGGPIDAFDFSLLFREHYAEGEVLAIPPYLRIDIGEGFEQGRVVAREAREASDAVPIGRVDLHHGTCPTLEGGVCENPPARWTKTSFPEDDIVVRHERRGTEELPYTSTYIYGEGFEEAAWSLGASEKPDWKAVRLALGNESAPRLNLTVLGTSEAPDLELQAIVEDLPTELELLLHVPQLDAVASVQHTPPEGFTLPEDVDVYSVDAFLGLDSADAPANMTLRRIIYRQTGELLALTQTPQVGTGYLHFSKPYNDPSFDGWDGRVRFDEPLDRLNLTWQRGVEPIAEGSMYLQLVAQGIPGALDLFQYKRAPDVITCAEGAPCIESLGVDLPSGGLVGDVDLWLSLNDNTPGRLLPVLPEVPDPFDPALDEAAPDFGMVHEDRVEGSDGAELRRARMALQVTNVSELRFEVWGNQTTLAGELPQEKDVDLYWVVPVKEVQGDGQEKWVQRYLAARVRDLEGVLSLDLWRDEPSPENQEHPPRLAVAASLSPLPGTTASPEFSVYLQGDLPFEFQGRPVTSYWFSADRVTNDFSLDLFMDDVQGTVVAIEAGPIHRLEGQALFEPQPGPGTTHCEPSEKRPLSLYLNKDQPDPQAIGELSLNLMTPGAARTTNTANHVVLTKSCGVGQDEQAMHVRATGLERVELDLVPLNADDLRVEATLEFQAQTVPRPFEFLNVENAEVTRLFSRTWPDVVSLHVDEPSRIIWFEGSGGVVEIDGSWWVNWVVPAGSFQASGYHGAPLGSRSTFGWRDFGQGLVNAVGGTALEFVSRGWISVVDPEDLLTLKVEYKGSGPWRLQADLDGVKAWQKDDSVSSIHPVFLANSGASRVAYRAQGFSLDVSGEPGGAFEGTSVWLANDPVDPEEPDGPRKRTIKRGGGHTYDDPRVSFSVEGRRYLVPACAWEGACS